MEVIPRKRMMIYFDLETEGLDPFESAIRCVGTVDVETGDVEIRTATSEARERDLIVALSHTLMTSLKWGGWNITEFDLPFLAVRADRYGLDFPIEPVSQEPYIGKYGNARVIIPFRQIHDMAYDYRELAEEMGVDWHLQSLAKTTGWEPSHEVTGADMPSASLTEVVAHLSDDLSAMYVLAHRYGIR